MADPYNGYNPYNPYDPRYQTPGYQPGSAANSQNGYYAPSNVPTAPNVAPGSARPGSAPPTADDLSKISNKKAVGPTDDIEKLLQQFYDEFNSPLDFNDPYVKSILDNAKASTAQSAGNAGVFGPYSQNLAQQAYIKAGAGLQDSRQNRAQQALGMLTAYKTDKRNFDYQKAQDAYTAAQDKWKYDQEHNSDLWRGIGGGLGAIGGGILGIPGGPAGIIAGASAGFGLGQQIGGGAYQAFGGGSPPPSFSPNMTHYRGGGN